MGIFNLFRILIGKETLKREITRINVVGQYIDIPSKVFAEKHTALVAYSELLEHVKRSAEAYDEIRVALQSYEPPSYKKRTVLEQQKIRLLKEQVIVRAEFIQAREQLIELFEELQPWLIEQQQLPDNAGAYAKQLLTAGLRVLEQAQKAMPIRRLK